MICIFKRPNGYTSKGSEAEGKGKEGRKVVERKLRKSQETGPGTGQKDRAGLSPEKMVLTLAAPGSAQGPSFLTVPGLGSDAHAVLCWERTLGHLPRAQPSWDLRTPPVWPTVF